MTRNLLLIAIFFAFSFSVASIFVDTNRETAKRNVYFQEQEEARATGGSTFAGPYCFPDRHPQVLFWISALTGLALLGAWFSKNGIIPTVLSLATLSVFGYWYFDTQRAIVANEWSRMDGLDAILYRANGFDVAVFVLLSTIVTWQVSRFSIAAVNSLKHESTLP